MERQMKLKIVNFWEIDNKMQIGSEKSKEPPIKGKILELIRQIL